MSAGADRSTAQPDNHRPADHSFGAARAGLHRVVLGARDLDRSGDFYRDVLDLTEVPAPSGGPRPVRRFASGSVLVEVTQVGAGTGTGDWVNDDLQGGIRHFGLKVGDVDERVRRLEAAGVTVLSPPRDVLGDVRIAFFLDPDGTRWEFIQGNLAYQHVHSPGLAAAEAATRLAPQDGPRFDHVAITVADLPAALRFWRDRFDFEVIGEIRHHDDPRGFLMTYLQAGPAVLEVFSFDTPVTPHPVPTEPGTLLGLHAIGLVTDESSPPVTIRDPEGVPVLVGGPR
ncbi:VOC family protein [Micromonospora sp. RHAY321]|uniref:VOC family protein n=1 Tax=Micromonospora sp. RHAY321 TaxID=2944807 RepID=UPI00207CBF96|nr:VOC family protein [Micromonospora sp. RHAY321]MCO1593918.1 VOC family protein [Micromonospora sp. RHAY321]